MSKRDLQKKEFLVTLMSNPELLELLSNDRLKIVLDYYKQENDRKRDILKNNYC